MSSTEKNSGNNEMGTSSKTRTRLQFECMLKKRKADVNDVTSIDNSEPETSSCKHESEDEDDKLRRIAKDTLLLETKNAAQRAALIGAQGWVKPRPLNTNKKFLARMLQSVNVARKDEDEQARKRKKQNG